MTSLLTCDEDSAPADTYSEIYWPGLLDPHEMFGGRRMLTMGNRPQDHRQRALLLASLLRDHRLRMFRRYCFETPDWAPRVPDGWPRETYRQAHQLIMLGAMQQHLLRRMRIRAAECRHPERIIRMLAAMEDCMPRGAVFQRRDMTDLGRRCGYARLCPWCHARSVDRLYRRLSEGPCAPGKLAGKHLSMIRVAVDTDGSCAYSEAEQELDRYVVDTFGDHAEVLRPSAIRSMRECEVNSLRQLAWQVGMEGGVLFHQISAYRIYDPPPERAKRTGFRHEFVLLGTTPESLRGTFSEWDRQDFSIRAVATMPAADPNALRYLLFGTSYKFRVERVDLCVEPDDESRFGLQGAARLQPWFLFTTTQALSYLLATQGVRGYEVLGSWRRSQRPCTRISRRRTTPFAWDMQESDKCSREEAFRRANAKRKTTACRRRQDLPSVAGPIYQELKSSLGRNPGSPALRQAMRAAGTEIADRDARWLVKNLEMVYSMNCAGCMTWEEFLQLNFGSRVCQA